MTKTPTRLYNLDYLRGSAAFLIMIYHLLEWSGVEFSSVNFLGRIGYYGVSVFYILSGLTLYHVYYERLDFSKNSLLDFFKKRAFRIFPVLWLVTILTVIVTGLKPNFNALFLNFTGLFGFIRWDAYIATGAWSIGNELVFYVCFPIFLYFLRFRKASFIILSIVIFSIGGYFAFFKLENLNLNDLWIVYINPLNQVFLFLLGLIVGHCLSQIEINQKLNCSIIVAALFLFIYYPTIGPQAEVIIGFNRVIFSLISAVIVGCFYKLKFQVPIFIHKPLTLLGETSYSVYLLHPLVYATITLAYKKFGLDFSNKLTVVSMTIFITLIVSYFVYEYYEKFFIKLGKRKFRLLGESV